MVVRASGKSLPLGLRFCCKKDDQNGTLDVRSALLELVGEIEKILKGRVLDGFVASRFCADGGMSHPSGPGYGYSNNIGSI